MRTASLWDPFHPGLPPIALGLTSPKFLHHFCDGIGRVGGTGRCCKQIADVACQAATIAMQAQLKHSKTHLQLCRESENGYGHDKKGSACTNDVGSRILVQVDFPYCTQSLTQKRVRYSVSNV